MDNVSQIMEQDANSSLLSKTSGFVTEMDTGSYGIHSLDAVLQIGQRSLDIFIYKRESYDAILYEEYIVNQTVSEAAYISAVVTTLKQHPILANTTLIKSIGINVKSHIFTAIPEELKALASNESLLSQTQRIPPNLKVMQDYLPKLQMYIIWALPWIWWQHLSEIFTDAHTTFMHQFTPLLSHTLQLPNPSKADQVFVHFENEYLMVWTIKKDKLSLINNFEYHFANDAIYYLQAVYHDQGLNPQEHTLYLMGDILSVSKVYEAITKYFAKPEFLPKPGHLIFENSFDGMVWHRYHDIFGSCIIQS